MVHGDVPCDRGERQPFALLHIPHSSAYIPADLRGTFSLDDRELSVELLRMTDSYTGELFRCSPKSARRIVYPVSRLVADPERFIEDEREEMARIGMGAVYTKTSDRKPLRSLDRAQRQSLIDRFYLPHHRRLNDRCRHALETGREDA